MGALGGMLGTAGGAGGTGFAPPQQAKITSPVTPEQLAASQTGVTNSLAGSDALLKALGGQGGLDKQTESYGAGNDLEKQLAGLGGTSILGAATGAQSGLNANLTGLGGTNVMGGAINQQSGLVGQLGGAGGVGLQTGAAAGLQDVLAQQQGLANQYQGIANGTGPNPAQAMLNNATGTNIANQAALMAGQRGAGANVGLMARQVGQQGAGIQQNAAGQAAIMQANQQLAALQALGSQQQAMGATNTGIGNIGSGLTVQDQAAIDSLYGKGKDATTMLQTGINNQANQGANIVNQQSNQVANNANVAGAMAGNLTTATNQNVNANLGNQQNVLGSAGNYNTNVVNSQGNVNSSNVGLAQSTMKGQQDLVGNAMNMAGLGGALAGGGKDGGGAASGKGKGASGPSEGNTTDHASSAPSSEPHQDTSQEGTTNETPGGYSGGDSGGYQRDESGQTGGTYAAQGGMIVPGAAEAVGPKSSFGQFLHTSLKGGKAMASGGAVDRLRSEGGTVKAKSAKQKAVKNGNSYDNDKIPAMLSEGEIVIPRSVLQSKDPVRSSADFVSKVLAKRGKK